MENGHVWEEAGLGQWNVKMATFASTFVICPFYYIYSYPRNNPGLALDRSVCLSVCLSGCLSVRSIYLSIYLPIYTYIHTYVRTYVHTYVRTYVRTYIHTYTHIYVYNVYIYLHFRSSDRSATRYLLATLFGEVEVIICRWSSH